MYSHINVSMKNGFNEFLKKVKSHFKEKCMLIAVCIIHFYKMLKILKALHKILFLNQRPTHTTAHSLWKEGVRRKKKKLQEKEGEWLSDLKMPLGTKFLEVRQSRCRKVITYTTTTKKARKFWLILFKRGKWKLLRIPDNSKHSTGVGQSYLTLRWNTCSEFLLLCKNTCLHLSQFGYIISWHTRKVFHFSFEMPVSKRT